MGCLSCPVCPVCPSSSYSVSSRLSSLISSFPVRVPCFYFLCGCISSSSSGLYEAHLLYCTVLHSCRLVHSAVRRIVYRLSHSTPLHSTPMRPSPSLHPPISHLPSPSQPARQAENASVPDGARRGEAFGRACMSPSAGWWAFLDTLLYCPLAWEGRGRVARLVWTGGVVVGGARW